MRVRCRLVRLPCRSIIACRNISISILMRVPCRRITRCLITGFRRLFERSVSAQLQHSEYNLGANFVRLALNRAAVSTQNAASHPTVLRRSCLPSTATMKHDYQHQHSHFSSDNPSSQTSCRQRKSHNRSFFSNEIPGSRAKKGNTQTEAYNKVRYPRFGENWELGVRMHLRMIHEICLASFLKFTIVFSLLRENGRN